MWLVAASADNWPLSFPLPPPPPPVPSLSFSLPVPVCFSLSVSPLSRWVNYHLAKSSSARRLASFSADLKDSEIYTHLMARICPEHCDLTPLAEPDVKKRAALVGATLL